jgi:hypothetical protein
MTSPDEASTLGQILDRLCGAAAEGGDRQGGEEGRRDVGDGAAAEGDDPGEVTLEQMLDAVGRRSFGPLLLLAGLVVLAPLIGDIPTVPTMMAVVVMLVAVQLLLQRGQFWLPEWLLRRSVERKKVRKAVAWLRRPAEWVDRVLRPRLTFLTGDRGSVVVALTCMLIALAMPPMELIPFSANGAGLALSGFGLALVTRDGLLALLSFAFTFGTLGWVGWALLA